MTGYGKDLEANDYEKEWEKSKCDKYDYMIAAFCGGAAGIIDVFFVGDPITSKLGKSMDAITDEFVKKAAQIFWKNDNRKSGKNKRMPQTLEQCISYLEQAFPVNYDARYAKDLRVDEHVLRKMSPRNHHLLSLAHSPDIIGLIFSIINQFTGYATFVDNGRIINVISQKTSNAIPYMQGSDVPSMIFCGFINWLGHILSDIAGSSSTRREGKTGRGAGIPIPFYELFQFCTFKMGDGTTFADTMIKVFEEGYDFRFGMAMSIPVVIEELMVRALWTVRQKFIRNKSWSESLPSKKHADLRIMLIVSNATFCLIDGTDATIHGLAEGNMISFICHLNLIGWARLVTLVLKELAYRYGGYLNRYINAFTQEIMDIVTPAEKKRIEEFKDRLIEYQEHLDQLFALFVKQIEQEYMEMYQEISATFDSNLDVAERANHSIKLAQISNVSEKKIIKSINQLDDFFR